MIFFHVDIVELTLQGAEVEGLDFYRSEVFNIISGVIDILTIYWIVLN